MHNSDKYSATRSEWMKNGLLERKCLKEKDSTTVLLNLGLRKAFSAAHNRPCCCNLFLECCSGIHSATEEERVWVEKAWGTRLLCLFVTEDDDLEPCVVGSDWKRLQITCCWLKASFPRTSCLHVTTPYYWTANSHFHRLREKCWCGWTGRRREQKGCDELTQADCHAAGLPLKHTVICAQPRRVVLNLQDISQASPQSPQIMFLHTSTLYYYQSPLCTSDQGAAMTSTSVWPFWCRKWWPVSHTA